jgi:hypothetical protein
MKNGSSWENLPFKRNLSYSFQMKIFTLLILFISLLGCSSKKGPKVAPDEYLKLNKLNSSKHKLCIQHKAQILEKPIKEVEEAELNDENYFFVRNEEKALFYIENFDLTKFTLKENQQENEAVIRACVMERDPNYGICDTIFSAFKFFRGLIYGMNQYHWSPATIEKSKALTLKYLEYVAQSESSLMDILFANDLLMRLAHRGYVDKALYNQTGAFRRDGEAAYKELKKKIRKLGKKDLTCDDADQFYSNERMKVKELSQNFLVILNQAK